MSAAIWALTGGRDAEQATPTHAPASVGRAVTSLCVPFAPGRLAETPAAVTCPDCLALLARPSGGGK